MAIKWVGLFCALRVLRVGCFDGFVKDRLNAPRLIKGDNWLYRVIHHDPFDPHPPNI